MRKGFLIYEEMHKNISPYMRRPLVIYDFATAPFWIFLILYVPGVSLCGCLLPASAAARGGRKEVDTLVKKKKNVLIYKEIQKGLVASHIWLTASSCKVKYWRISSYIRKSFLNYMTLHPIPSEFPYIWGKFSFLFLSVQQQYWLIAELTSKDRR